MDDDEAEVDTMESRLSKRRNWDDEFVLKRSFTALIPAFDPRPGRTNVNQTTDIDVRTPGSVTPNCTDDNDGSTAKASPKLVLKLRVRSGTSDLEIDLTNPNWTLFSAAQTLMTHFPSDVSSSKQEKVRRIWEPTYSIIYRPSNEIDQWIETNQSIQNVEVRELDIVGHSSDRSLSRVVQPDDPLENVDDVLNLLKSLNQLLSEPINEVDELINTSTINYKFKVPKDEFVSKKITNKLNQQIQDALVLSSESHPSWCEKLTFNVPMLFPFETRQVFFASTAFGTSRSIVWLQSQRDSNLDRIRGPSPRREDPHEFRVGRLRHERVKVPRGENILDWAVQVMEVHADRKAILEIEFLDEEGTGLGPTLEFYALVAAELQRYDLGLWVCDDALRSAEVKSTDESDDVRPPGFYVQSANGLFPAPLPQDSPQVDQAAKYFRFLGIFLAKALQDNRLVDLPLSTAFLRILVSGAVDTAQDDSLFDLDTLGHCGHRLLRTESNVSSLSSPHSQEDMITAEREEMAREARHKSARSSSISTKKSSWFHGTLDLIDLVDINTHQAVFLQQLQELAITKSKILSNNCLSMEDRLHQVRNLSLPTAVAQPPVLLEDLELAFQYLPTSKVYGFAATDLKPFSENDEVSIDNVEDYVDLMTDFCLHSGIKKQMDAFRGKCFTN